MKKLILPAFFCLAAFFLFVNFIPAKKEKKVKTTQVRIFTINRGKMNEFVSAWQKGVYPLRIKYGFTIEKAWVVREKNKFIWILSYDGPEGFEAKDSAYYASQARITLQPNPVDYIADSENYFLDNALPE